MPGCTAVAQAKAGETVVVGAASGAVGAIAGQLAKIAGCRVVGVAGGADKCRYVVDELGFDACLDRREPDLAGRLQAACPDGVDVYIELVGGELLWSLLPLFNLHARIPVIGAVAWYNLPALPDGAGPLAATVRAILTRRLRVEGTLSTTSPISNPSSAADRAPGPRRPAQVQGGRRRGARERARSPDRACWRARNFGKLLVQVSPDPTR